jgi:hypothetical protein
MANYYNSRFYDGMNMQRKVLSQYMKCIEQDAQYKVSLAFMPTTHTLRQRGFVDRATEVLPLHLVLGKCHYLIPEDRVMAVQPLYLVWRKCHYQIPEDRVMAVKPFHLVWRK